MSDYVFDPALDAWMNDLIDWNGDSGLASTPSGGSDSTGSMVQEHACSNSPAGELR